MRGMSGQGWPVEEMMKLFLALLFGAGLVLLIMFLSGALGPLLEEICEQHPEWPFCQGQTFAIDYQTAKSSTAALTCAINTVAQGELWAGSFIIGEGENAQTLNCNDFYSASATGPEKTETTTVLCPVPYPPVETGQTEECEENCQTECEGRGECTGSSISNCRIPFGAGEYMCDCEMTYKEYDKAFIECEEGEGETISKGYLVAQGDGEAKVACESFCSEPGICTGLPQYEEEIEWTYLRKENEILRCDCTYEHEGDVQVETIYGVTRAHIMDNCRDHFSGWLFVPLWTQLSISNCQEVYVISGSDASDAYNDIKDDSEILLVKGKTCECENTYKDGQTETYHSYGLTEEESGSACQRDINYDGLLKEEDQLVSGIVKNCQDFSGSALFFMEEPTFESAHKYKCNHQVRSLECTVNNFRLPQDVGGLLNAEEWLKAAGDPDFLVYWQQFPQGEDSAWAGAHPWIEDAIDLVFAWWGVGKIFKLGKTALKKPVQWAASKLGFKTAAEKLSQQMIAAGISETLAKELSLPIAQAIKNQASLLNRLLTLGLYAEGVVAEGSLLLGAYLNSKALKYANFSNSLILKSPYKNPESVSLSSDIDGKVVILGERSTSFYLASPCKAELEVKKSDIKCEKYSYDFENKIIDCHEPELDYSGDVKTCDTDISNNFPSGSEVPNMIENLNGDKDKLKFYWYDNGRLNIKDPVTELVYEFLNDKLSTEVGEIANPLIRLKFTDSNGQDRSFIVSVDEGKIENEDFSFNFQEDYHYCIQRYDYYNPACVIVPDRDSFTILNSDCEYCNELEEKIDTNRWMVFKEEAEEIEDEDGNPKETMVKKLGLIYGEDGTNYYWTNFLDSTDDKISDFISMKWADTPTSIILKVSDDIADDVFLGDNDEDGKMDFITINNCVTIGESVSVERDETISGYNFCYPETNWIKSVARWAPVAGAGLGAIIGGAIGFFGGGVGAGPGVSAGTVWGTNIGAGIFTAYLVFEKLTGSTDIWPGEKY